MKGLRRRWGSITRYRDGWRVRGGDEERTTVGVFRDADFGGRDNAELAAEEALEEARRAWLAAHAPKGRGATLIAYGRALLDRLELEGVRRGIDRDRARFEKHLATAPFANDPIASIEHRQIQRFIRTLAAGDVEGPRARNRAPKKRSRRTVLRVLNLLRTILRFAIEEEIIDESPARGVIVPRMPTIEEDFLLLEQREVDLVLAYEPDERVSIAQISAFTVAIFTGMRPGELWGLRWGDVPSLDEPGGEVIVRYSRGRATKGGRVRRVPLLEPARGILLRWRAGETVRRKRAPRPDELVWPSPSEQPFAEGYDAGWANRRQTKSGIRWTQLGARWRIGITTRIPLKDLRHTCASALLRGWWVERGWIARPLSMVEIAAWLGHRSITTTEAHYARLAPGGLRDIVRRELTDN